MKNNNYYIEPSDLSAALYESQQLSCCTGQMAIYICKLNKAVRNFEKFRYLPKEILDEMESYSNYRLMKRGIYSADVHNPKLFSYFTTAISTNMLQRKIWLTKKASERREFEKQMFEKAGYQYLDYNSLREDCEEDGESFYR